MVKELDALYEANQKIFEANPTTNLSEQEVDLLSTADNKRLIMRLLLHGADTSNPTKPWTIARDWAYRVLDEYANQGDQEKTLGIPVQVLNDREKVNRPNSQIGFVEFIIAPWVMAEVKVFPALFEASLLLETNLHSWEHLWIQESNPDDEARAKVKGRVEKMVATLRNRPMRGAITNPAAAAAKPASTRRRSFLG